VTLAPFQNEPYTDFTQPAAREAMLAALQQTTAQCGREYLLWIGGKPFQGTGTFESRDPSLPSRIIGIHQKATVAQARDAVDCAQQAFAGWGKTPAEQRARLTVECAAVIRRRKFEFNSWMVLEAGKSWAEAEADTSEAIDFCEYYARQMLTLDRPEPLVQLAGERDQLRYLPLGVGVVIPPWNFPLAIMTGMTIAALVAGNTVVLKPSSDTPTIAAKFVEALHEAGFPVDICQFITGSGGSIGDAVVSHPKTRFVSFTGSKAVGLHVNELAAKPQPGQIWIKRVVAEMGGKDAIVVADDADLDAAAQGIIASAFGFQGQKCSACSRAIIDAKVYDTMLEKLKAGAAKLAVGPATDPANQMGPVINERAMANIQAYTAQGKKEGRLVAGGGRVPGDGYFLEPTIIADVQPEAAIFREEIFGPVLAVTKARNFDHALELANQSEYGLTGALYSKDPARLRRAENEFFVGNLYLNRKCTGAMVGAHPFGGFNMSGTDSKAGGPDYLLQFLQAKSIAERLA